VGSSLTSEGLTHASPFVDGGPGMVNRHRVGGGSLPNGIIPGQQGNFIYTENFYMLLLLLLVPLVGIVRRLTIN